MLPDFVVWLLLAIIVVLVIIPAIVIAIFGLSWWWMLAPSAFAIVGVFVVGGILSSIRYT